jgi:NAD(P)-dependent dehydrogenase (short-subunit alcohol dehydrogenase family)
MSEGRYHALDNAYPDPGVLAGGLAVITGGASGIGYALAEAAIAHGLSPILADIESAALGVAKRRLDASALAAGVEVFAVKVDVSSEQEVQALASAVAQKFPGKPVSLLCCNAGVGGGGGVLVASDVDWDFVLGVNVKGVANCVRAFVPNMLKQSAPGSVVTTASQDGLCAAQGVYGVSKHAAVALTEALYAEVRGRLSVHVLCPNVVSTNIVTSGRNRPDRFGGPVKSGGANPIAERFKAFGMPPSKCADLVFSAIESGVFYILAEADDDPGYVRLEAETRMNAILTGGRPYRPRSALISRVFDLRVPLPDAGTDQAENHKE